VTMNINFGPINITHTFSYSLLHVYRHFAHKGSHKSSKQ